MNPTKKILVTGATGFVGSALVKYLSENGYSVRAAIHHTPPKKMFAGVEYYKVDILDPKKLSEALDGIQIVFHLASLTQSAGKKEPSESAFQKLNIEGTTNLVAAAEKSGVEQLVYFSSISVYGPSNGGKAWDESDSPRPTTVYGRTKYAAESVVLHSKVPATVLRLSSVYGKGMVGNYKTLFHALRLHIWPNFLEGKNRRTLIHIDDLCRAAHLVASSPRAISQIYNVSDGNIHQFNAIIDAICKVHGRKSPTFKIPMQPLLWLGQLTRHRINIEKMLQKLTEDMAVSGIKIQSELGFKANYDLIAGWQTLLSP